MFTLMTFKHWSTVAYHNDVNNKFLHMISQRQLYLSIYQYTFLIVASLTVVNIGTSEIILKDMSTIDLYKPHPWQSASRLHMCVGVCNRWNIWTALFIRELSMAVWQPVGEGRVMFTKGIIYSAKNMVTVSDECDYGPCDIMNAR